MQIHRFRIVLRMTASAKLHFHQAAEIYALMAHANGMASGADAALPDGLLLDVPEQCRVVIASGNEYAFGFTLLAGSPQEAKGRVKRLIAALEEAGGTRGIKGGVFSNNFRVIRTEDLVAHDRFDDSKPPEAIPLAHIQAEIEQLKNLPQLTLRFVSPLRFHLPKSLTHTGHAFADGSWFDPAKFIERASGRQESLGIVHCWPLTRSQNDDQHQNVNPDLKASSDQCELIDPNALAVTDTATSYVRPNDVKLVRNDLVWMDLTYGFAADRKRLGGSLGSVVIQVTSPADIERLVWGQYAAVGDNTRFGFGRYRIDELGPDPFRCERSVNLTRLALRPGAIDQAAERYGVDSGTCSELVRRVDRGVYQPEPYQRVTIQSGSRSRELSIPAKSDRVLQRAVHELLAPALDQVFEESSLAFRQGLGRQRAASRLRDAVRDGFRWALRADIDDFFDTIDHAQLEVRVRAYLADDELASLIMEWVRIGAPQPGRGIPTGAVISPLIANLFLDQFDERIAKSGGRLVRYADDFTILYRTEAAAKEAHRLASDAAQALKLSLNSDKTQLVDLHEPFTFLGFRFHREVEWEIADAGVPRPVEDLGWHDVGSQRDESGRTIELPGETLATMGCERATVILGPGIRWLGARDRQFTYGYGEGGIPSGTIPLDRIEHVLVLGEPTIYEELVREISEQAFEVTVLDDWCRPRARLGGPTEPGSAELVLAQAALAADPPRRLAMARTLITAKLRNHAVLADATPGRKKDQLTGPTLRQRADDATKAQEMSELLGIEGAAAALWYSRLNERLPTDFSFERRVAPHATDPINILLNIAQTILYRMICGLLAGVGLNQHIGCLHLPRSGHASLASDLQEPFRHLMDRAVLDATRRILPADFTKKGVRNRITDSVPDTFLLRMRPAASRRFIEQVHRLLAVGVKAVGSRDVVPYRIHLARMIRSYKQHLLHPEQPFRPFEHDTEEQRRP